MNLILSKSQRHAINIPNTYLHHQMPPQTPIIYFLHPTPKPLEMTPKTIPQNQ